MKKVIKEISPFNNIESDNIFLYIVKILIKTFLVYFISLLISEAIVVLTATLLGFSLTFNDDMNIMLLFKYYGYIVVIALFIIFIKKFLKMELKDIGIDKNIKPFFKGILLGFITLLSIVLILIFFKEIKYIGLNKSIDIKIFILFIGAWFIQSSFEEFICRGFLFHKLKQKTSIILAIIISFMFFFVGHVFELFNDGILLGIIGIINLLLPSIIWALMVLKDKNIYGAIGFHYIWNFCLFNIIGLNVSGLDSNLSLLNFKSKNSFLTGASYGIESSIITTIILIIVLLFVNKNLNLKNKD